MKDVEGWEVGTWYGHPIYKVQYWERGGGQYLPLWHFLYKYLYFLQVSPFSNNILLYLGENDFSMKYFLHLFTYQPLLFQTTGDKWFDPEVNEFYAHTSNPEKRKFGNHVNWLKMD